MSWFFKSFPADADRHSPSSSAAQGPGVKDDLSVLGEAIGRQLRGVAAFLAPPPSVAAAGRDEVAEEGQQKQQSHALYGIRNDLVEIGDSFKSGLSRLSSNKAVSGISRFASSFLQLRNRDDQEDDDDGIPGITEEVVDFVKEISLRPECWTDFPLSLDNDFKMSAAQREHALNIQHLVPSFSALRFNLQSSMAEERFWMIYFIFLLPRLNEYDFELLSTPEVVATRDVLLQKLHDNRNSQVKNSDTCDAWQESCNVRETYRENIPSGERVVTEITNAAQGLEIEDEDNTLKWWEEADISSDTSVVARRKNENEEDASFSDLEDDNNDHSDKPSTLKLTKHIKASPSGSNEWVQLNSSPEKSGLQKPRQSTSEGESSDWLAVDDFD
ncbi:hypothetical protein SLEP1_g15021 [Rubroshorea leprosula]|uniref:BSD domain-containing protein n=1 Tax=Rubroshorea leprosula TaxID=152421 RepID=A0AAV5IWR7_9ROSI|nr:hypothetical protein SLEP1_g15021 [Rubroshorea leprosula]